MCHMDDKEVPGRELVVRGLLKANSGALWHYHSAPEYFVATLELLSMEFIHLYPH